MLSTCSVSPESNWNILSYYLSSLLGQSSPCMLSLYHASIFLFQWECLIELFFLSSSAVNSQHAQLVLCVYLCCLSIYSNESILSHNPSSLLVQLFLSILSICCVSIESNGSVLSRYLFSLLGLSFPSMLSSYRALKLMMLIMGSFWGHSISSQWIHKMTHTVSLLGAFHEFATHTVSSLLPLHGELIRMISPIAYSKLTVWVTNTQKAHCNNCMVSSLGWFHE